MSTILLPPLGFRADGRPFYPIMGAAEDGDTGEGDTGQGDGDQGDTGDGGDQGDGDQGEPDFDSLPKATQDEIRKLRRQNQALRSQVKGKSKTPAGTGAQEAPNPADAIVAALKAAGIIPDDATGTTGKADTSSDDLRAARVETAVYRVAASVGANPDSVTDSIQFQRATADLDPSDADFEKDVKAAVQDAVRQNAALRAGAKVTPRTPKSGGDLAGGTGTSKTPVPLTPQQRMANYYAASSST